MLYVARAAIEGRRPAGRYGRIARDAIFTAEEREFLQAPAKLSQRFKLRAEAALPLFWALGYVRQMRWPANTLSAEEFWAHLAGTDFLNFVSDSQPVAMAAIAQEADLITRLSRASEGAGVHPGVIGERRLALDWLTNSGPQADWDALDRGLVTPASRP